MRKGIQDMMSAMGNGGCFVLAILKYCQDNFNWNGDIITAIYIGIDNKLIHYNPNDKNDPMSGYVYNSLEFIRILTGLRVKECRLDITGYEKTPVPNKINFWQLPNAVAGVGHFTYGGWCSLENSNTVKNGYLKQVRHYEVIG